MMPTRRLLQSIVFCALVVAGVCSASISTVCAQDVQETATARALFKEGVELADAGDWSGAEDRFRRAYALRPSPVIAFNWVSTLEQLGRLLEATEMARAITKNPEADEALVRGARAKIEELEPRLASLTVNVSGETEGVAIFVDENQLPRPAWGVAAPADPGDHVARAEREGETVVEAPVTLAEGEASSVSLEVPAPEPEPEPEPIVTPPPEPVKPPEPARKPMWKNPWLWTAVGVVVVAGGVTGGILAAGGGGTESPPEGNTDPPVLRF